MKKMIKFVQYGWIFIAIASLYEIITLWGTGKETLFFITLPFAIAMFFLRRWQARKMDKARSQREEKTTNE